MKLPDWKIERLALGELPADEARALSEEAGPELEALRRDDVAILAAHPPAAVAAEVARRAGRSVPGSRMGWVLIPVAAALAVAVLVPRGPAETAGETILEKGSGPTLRVYRRTDSGVERLANGASARAGDRLRLATVGAGAGVLVSVDGRGGVTLHLPSEGDAPALLPAGESPLPEAYELDDAPGFERFVLVTGDSVRPEAVLAAARRLATDPHRARSGPLPLPPSLHQVSLLILKETP